MPQDLLQISLEHHRAGRVRQAEQGYRALLEADPSDVDALHWLGVLALQSQRPQDAIPLLEKAASLRPDDAAFAHNLGQAYLSAGRADDAVRSLRTSIALEPAAQPGAYVALGVALLARNQKGDAPPALDALQTAQRLGIDSAELHHHLCAALGATGQFKEAIAAGHCAIQKDPNRIGAYQHLALAYKGRGDTASAKSCLATLLSMHPDYPFAWHGVGIIEAEAGNLGDAAVLFRKAIALKPDYVLAYHALSQVLQADNKPAEALIASQSAARIAGGQSAPVPQQPLPEAIATLERRLQQSRQTSDLHFTLAAKMGVFAPNRIPLNSVADLFDRYAGHFDEHLRDKLQYRVPELIAELLARDPDPSTKLDILDLGCGTGMCGNLLRARAGVLCGVDLSPLMIEKSKARGIYDHLECIDLESALQNSGRKFDLIIAADVLIYTGDWAPIFETVMSVLTPGGRFIFSTEVGAGDRYQMNTKSLRYTHSDVYVRRLGAMYGFIEDHFSPIMVRVEATEPVEGRLVVLRKPADARN